MGQPALRVLLHHAYNTGWLWGPGTILPLLFKPCQPPHPLTSCQGCHGT